MNKKKILLFLLFLPLFTFAQEGLDEIVEVHSAIADDAAPADTAAEVKPWKHGGNFAITFSQVSLTNWVAGGENAISGNASFLFTANYHKGDNKWDNTLDLGYGLTQQGEDKVIKNEDKIDFSSRFGRKATEKWFYSAMFGFKSQFDEGYISTDDPTVISNFLAPAYLLASIGMDYRPSEKITVFLSPITGRLTIVNDESLSDQGAFGVEKGERTKPEIGGFVRIGYQDNFFEEKLGLRTKLELFSSYGDKPQNLDVNWEFALDLKVGNYITARLSTTLIYDEDALPEIQFRQMVGVGFSYRF